MKSDSPAPEIWTSMTFADFKENLVMDSMVQQEEAASRADSQSIAVTVVIPALNEEMAISNCLSSLVRQDLPSNSFEVIVVDNGSTDHTVEIARSFASSLHLMVIQEPKRSISALRNLGARAAKGQYLAFLDSDCIAPKSWLKDAINLLKADDRRIVGAFYSIPERSSWLARAWYSDMYRIRQGPVSYVPAGTLFVGRRTFRQLNGFDEGIPTSEDFEFCYRARAAGLQVLGFPILSTLHLGTPQTLSGFYRKERWHGIGVRTAFQRNLWDRRFRKTILFTLYWLFWLTMTLATIPITIVLRRPALLLLAPAFLLLASLWLAALNAVERKRWDVLGSLTVLYIVYGLARSISFIGFSKKRSERCPQLQSVLAP